MVNHDHIQPKLREDVQKFVVNSYPQCDPTLEAHASCPINELCLMVDRFKQVYECVCLEEKKFFKIENVCRELLQTSQSCDLYLSECRKELNEECVTLNDYNKHGTCQCKAGYKRNLNTFVCESFDLKLYTNIVS